MNQSARGWKNDLQVEGEVRPFHRNKEVLGGAFFWLTAFYFFYCARPEDLIPALNLLPLAKIASGMAILSLFLGAQKIPRKLKDLPKEAWYLLIIIAALFVSALLSPIWRGGAFGKTVEFSKVWVVWVLTFLLVTSLKRLRRIIFIQVASVALICVIALVKGHGVERLNGVIGAAVYSNPNDFAFAIVLSLPFCLAFLLSAQSKLRKAVWCVAVLIMAVTLMITASRAGFIDLLISGAFTLWFFGIKGKRLYLIVAAFFFGTVLFLFAGKDLEVRLAGLFNTGDSALQNTAYGSYAERRMLVNRAFDAIAEYPILGVGAGNFIVYSGLWKDVHVTYLEIAADGGIFVLILFLMFLYRGFANLQTMRRTQKLDDETKLFVGALASSLIGFVVGACFAPEAYQLFPYFTVCYTSVLVMLTKEHGLSSVPVSKAELSPARRFARAY